MNETELNNIQKLPKLLLVEDDDISVDVMRLFLKGYVEIDSARTAKETMDKVLANQYDLILMDINLGKGPTGIDLIKQIRNLPNYKGTKVIAVTAFAMKGDREEFLSSGFDFYLAKPFTKEELRSTIKRFLK